MIVCSRRSSLPVLALSFLFSPIVVLLLVLSLAEAKERKSLSVMGVTQGGEEFNTSTQGNRFSMIQYTPDPIEGFNRGSLSFTKPVIHWFIRPAAKGWRFISPTPVRESIDKFSYNLAFPKRFVSLLLQGRPVDSVVETGHFLVNTTIGLVGFFDPASQFGIPTYSEDVGQAFGTWGSGPGFYFFIPLLGPSSGRDAAGNIFDMALSPATYIPGVGTFFAINSFSFKINKYESFVKSERELYLPIRALWSIQRKIAVDDYVIPEEAWDASDPEPSLGVLLLHASDENFLRRKQEGSVKISGTERNLPYSLWLQKEQAPIVYLIPGIGAYRNSNNPVAIAEMAYKRGYSVVVVSSPFHWEFIIHALSSDYPGYTPSDAEDLYAALSHIHKDLKDHHPGLITSARLMGYSLGAIETLFIAAAQAGRSANDLHFERFVAINPPVDLRYAAKQFDNYFDAPLQWDTSIRDQKIMELAMKAFLVMRDGVPEGKSFPFDRIESEFLIGLSVRTMLVNTMAAIRERGAETLEIKPEYDEERGRMLSVINESTLRNYAQELVIPYYLSRELKGLTSDRLARTASMYSVEEVIRNDDRIRIVTNANDFILGEEGLVWLREIGGERVTVFPDGGHVGNMHLEIVQKAVFSGLRIPSDRPFTDVSSRNKTVGD